MPKTHHFAKILVRDAASLTLDEFDDIDTGDIDGSGEITVQAVDASHSDDGVEFYQVSVEVTDDYASWTRESLRDKARSMLERDYTL